MFHLVETLKFVHGSVTVTRDRSPVAKLPVGSETRNSWRDKTRRVFVAGDWSNITTPPPGGYAMTLAHVRARRLRALRARNPQSSTGIGIASTLRGAISHGLEDTGGRPRRKCAVANRNSSDTVAIRKSDVVYLQALTLVSNNGMLRLEIGRQE